MINFPAVWWQVESPAIPDSSMLVLCFALPHKLRIYLNSPPVAFVLV